MDEIAKVAREKEIKNYIKIFFDEEIELYKSESKIYFAIKIFNDIKYSKILNDSIYGPPDSNMGLNSKKPFLEQKSRKLSIPFMVLNDDALLIKKFFDWVKFQDGRNLYPLGKHLFLYRDYKQKDLIGEFDYIPWRFDRLPKPITVQNFLNVPKHESYKVESVSGLEQKIDELFFNKQLIYNYFNNDIKVSNYISKNLQTLIYETRTAMLNYFKKYDPREFYQAVRKYGDRYVIEQMRQSGEYRAIDAMNLKLALLQYKGEKIMDIQDMQKRVIEKLDANDYTPLDKDTFFYLSGQIAKYLLNQSEAHEKNADLIEPFLRANNAQKLKKDIEFTYFNYKHKIGLNYSRFNNAMSLVMAYEGEDKLSKNMDRFLVGVLSDNIFYMKKEA